MEQTKIRDKMIYFLSLMTMCLILVGVAYLFFLREIKVDVMANVHLEYTGENGHASVKALNQYSDLNQRTQEFMDSVTYEISPTSSLSNGDIVHVKASWSQELAERYHFQAIHTEEEFIVSGLPDRIENLDQMDPEYVAKIEKETMRYVEKHASAIEALYPDAHEKASLEEIEVVYSAFLKTMSQASSDRYVQVMRLHYDTGPRIYLVIVPEINTSQKVMVQDIYGERAYLNQQEIETEDYSGYVQRVFSHQYSIESKNDDLY